MENLVVEIKRTNQKIHFEGVSAFNPDITIPFDYAPPLGDGQGFAGLELLLLSFSGCVSTAMVVLLGRAGKHVASYAAKVEGVRREHPLSLSEILFHIRIASEDITAEDMDAVIRQAEMISPVWLAVKNNVDVKITYELS